VRAPGRRCPPITAHRRCSTGPSTAAAGLVATTAGDLADIETATRAGGRRSRGCGGCAQRWAGRRGGGCPCPAPTPSSAAVQIAGRSSRRRHRPARRPGGLAPRDVASTVVPELAEALAGTDPNGALPSMSSTGCPSGASTSRAWAPTPMPTSSGTSPTPVPSCVLFTPRTAGRAWRVHLDRPTLAEAIESMLAPGQGQRCCEGASGPMSPTTAWPSSSSSGAPSWPPCCTRARPRPTSSTPTAAKRAEPPGARRRDEPGPHAQPTTRWATLWASAAPPVAPLKPSSTFAGSDRPVTSRAGEPSTLTFTPVGVTTTTR